MDVLSTASETNAAGQDITGTPSAVFLYRLVPGHQTPSFGLHCAKVGKLWDTELKQTAEHLKV